MKNVPAGPAFSKDLEIIPVSLAAAIPVPFFEFLVPAGFPSPAEDYSVGSINIAEFITSHPDNTFFFRVQGNSMIDAGILPGSLVAIDRTIIVKSGDIVVAVVNNEFTIKQYEKRNGKVRLIPYNENYQPVTITEYMDFSVWGKVVACINKL